MNRGHGSPYDRGMADSYYHRGRLPHKMVGNEMVWLKPDTVEWNEYQEGYDMNEFLNIKKDWGSNGN